MQRLRKESFKGGGGAYDMMIFSLQDFQGVWEDLSVDLQQKEIYMYIYITAIYNAENKY